MSFESSPQPFHELRLQAATDEGARLANKRADNSMGAGILAKVATDYVSVKERKGGIPPAAWPPQSDPCWEVVGIDAMELSALYHELDGYLVFPGLSGYDAARSATEPAFPIPRVIAVCAGESDIATCAAWADRQDWPISVRGGGHNGAGFHLCSGITLDLQSLSSIDIDKAQGTVTVGAGVRWNELSNSLAKEGMFVPGGICGHVGVVGYTMGGGYSLGSRIFGMTSDLLVQARVLCGPQLELVEATPRNKYSDLFWALSGGGGGQFGVTVDMTFRMQALRRMFGFALNWKLQDAPKVLHCLENSFTITGQDGSRLGYVVAITHLTADGHPDKVETDPSLTVLGIFDGDEQSAQEELQIALEIGKPTWRWRKSGTYHEINSEIMRILPYRALDLVAARKLEVTGYVSDSHVNWEGLVAAMKKSPNPGNLIAFEPYGGAIGRKLDSSSFPHRGQKLNLKLNSYWNKNWIYNKDRFSAQTWLDEVRHVATSALNGSVYVNYMREDVRNYQEAYWGDSFDQLVRIKDKYDEKQRFRFPQSLRR